MKKIIALLLMTTLVGCLESKHVIEALPAKQGGEKKPAPLPGRGPNDVPTTDEFKFAIVKARVFDPKCVRCHRTGHENPAQDNPNGVNLQTYAAIKAKLTVLKEVVTTGEMGFDPLPALTNYERALVLGWIDLSAPE